MAVQRSEDLEAARAVWHTWQEEGMRDVDPVLQPVSLNVLPSTDLGFRMYSVYERPYFSFKIHLVLPSAAQVRAFDENDVVDELVLRVTGHLRARPDVTTVLVTPLLADGIRSHTLLRIACIRGIDDIDAWQALCRYANPPGCEFSAIRLPAVWFV